MRKHKATKAKIRSRTKQFHKRIEVYNNFNVIFDRIETKRSQRFAQVLDPKKVTDNLI
jgi:hypothetical protein